MPGELATSRDGIHWQRSFQDQMFLPVSGRGDTFDAGCLWTNATPVFLPNEMRFYYGAYPRWNSDVDNDASGVGLATLPRDRFAAVQPIDKIAQVTLEPIDLANVKKMVVNADASAGHLQVELLTATGYRVGGFSMGQAVPMHKDSLRQLVEWNDKSIADLPAGKYQLRIHLNNAKLFAITVHD